MITTAEEYLKYLAYIQSDNHPKIAILPSSEKIYNIDLKTLTIETPKYLSVEHDHKSETVYFKVDRYFDYMDLSETVCVVQYVTADNEARIYPVPFYDITTYAQEGKMLVPWCIDGGATATPGTVQYSLRFYKVDEVGQRFLYNLNTQPTSSKVLYGMEVTEMTDDYDLEVEVYYQVLAKLAEFELRLGSFWEDKY